MAPVKQTSTTPLPSGLIRFWLQQEYTRGALNVPRFAKKIGVTPAAVHNWLSGERGERRGISEGYWDAIATFFHYHTPEHLLAAARKLHASQTITSTPNRDGKANALSKR